MSSIEIVFRLTNYPEDQKVECTAFMLRSMHIYGGVPPESLSDLGGEISWAEFKEAFAEAYSPEDVQTHKHQEFTHLKQRGRSVTAYVREFAKLKCFAPDLVDTDYRTARRFLLGLDSKIRNVVEAITPTTYADTLRVARAMEGTDGSNESRSSTERQKRRRDGDDRVTPQK